MEDEQKEIKYYSGIGSRQTPQDVCDLMTVIARYLYFKGYTLRSGGAKAADSAFEAGAGAKKEIFLPWKKFNEHDSPFYKPQEEAYKIASEIHPNWQACKEHVRCFHARNALIILGKDLQTPSDFVVCWTRDGKMFGGTSIGIRMARKFDIPVFNLAIEKDKNRILDRIKDDARRTI